jgi:alpha-L-rhamnosidase
MKDIAADQKIGGEVPDVIPDVLNPQKATSAAPSAGWGDVSVITPWTMYLVYGDKKMLASQYPSMKKWVEYIRNKAGSSYLWKGGSKYGDWLFYHPPVNNHPEPDGYTEPDFIATAYFAYSTSLLARAAKELGNSADEKTYTELYNKIRDAFIHEYVTPAGRVGTCSQTSYILALKFGLLPEDLRGKAAGFLIGDIRSRSNHLSTGFLGTIYICHELTEMGFTNVAYDLLLQESYPSWLYPVKMGATTIWERWDGQKTDSTFQDEGMNSFNHYAYGAIGDWMYRVSAGIEQMAPGYKKLILQPHPTKKLNYARATFESSYGTIASGWERKDGKIIIRVSIPANTSATVMIPVDDAGRVTENGHQLNAADQTIKTESDLEGKKLALTRGSGDYSFEFAE